MKLKKFKLAILTFVFLIGSIMPVYAAPTDTVVFADDNLKIAINEELGESDDYEPTEGDMESLTSFTADDKEISSLSGLEYAINLETLDLNTNYITEISELESLTKLQTLNLMANYIEDISVLEDLADLTSLNVSENNIIDVSVLENLVDSNPGITIEALDQIIIIETAFADNTLLLDNPFNVSDLSALDFADFEPAATVDPTTKNITWDSLPNENVQLTLSFSYDVIDFSGEIIVNALYIAPESGNNEPGTSEPEPEPETVNGIIIRFFDEATNAPIAEEQLIMGVSGETFRIEPKKIEGYEFVREELKTPETVTFAEGAFEENQILTFFYKKIGENPKTGNTPITPPAFFIIAAFLTLSTMIMFIKKNLLAK